MRILFLSIALSTAIFPLQAEPEIKGSPTELTEYLNGIPRTVTIAGESEIKVQADRATLTLRIVTEDRSLETALRANQILRSRLNLLMTQAGIDRDSILSGKFASTPKSGAFSDKARSYKVENSMKVNVTDEKQFNAVAKLVDTNPEVYYGGVEFERSDKSALQSKGLNQAMQEVLLKKKAFEETLDVNLVAKKFNEAQQSPVNESAPAYADRESSAKSWDSYASGSPVTYSFGELVFKTVVTVDYAVVSNLNTLSPPRPINPPQRTIPSRTLRVPPIAPAAPTTPEASQPPSAPPPPPAPIAPPAVVPE